MTNNEFREDRIYWLVLGDKMRLAGVTGQLQFDKTRLIHFTCHIDKHVDVSPEEPYGKILIGKMKEQIALAIRKEWRSLCES
jgi:hypothetical protein